MKFPYGLSILLILALIATPVAAASAPSAWKTVGTGIEYQEFSLEDPVNHVYVARMERSNPGATIDSGIAMGKLASGGAESVRGMANRYDETLNDWDPNGGARSNVVVAINGSYFLTGGIPISGQVQSGWYVKRFDNLSGGSGFAWTYSRQAFIGQCVANPPDRQVITYATGETQRINAINVPRGQDQLVVYTPQYDATTGTDSSGSEVLVELLAPAGIVPIPHYVRGLVKEVRNGQGSTPIPFDSIVLSASGSAQETLLKNVQVNDEIHLSQEITSYQSDCSTPMPVDWTNTYASIGGAVTVLKDGQVQAPDKDTVYAPRTAIAYNDDYVYFIVVDGRRPSFSNGMTFGQLGAFARDTLDAIWAIAEDGGGSSTMVVNGAVVNRPVSACYAVYLPLVMGGASQSPTPSPYPAPGPQAGQTPTVTAPNPGSDQDSGPASSLDNCERKVANTLMMVAVEPKQTSTAPLSPFDLVETHSDAALRLGPGTNYDALETVPAGTTGVILDDLSGLNGVLAKGSYWWKVAFGNSTGWMAEGDFSYKSSLPWNVYR